MDVKDSNGNVLSDGDSVQIIGTKGVSFEYFLSDLDLNRTSSMMKNKTKLIHSTELTVVGTA
jgi:uncharacterized Zn ribbon protein